MCHGCGRRHREDGLIHGQRFRPEVIGSAIGEFYHGHSTRTAADFVTQVYRITDTKISPQTVWNWVHTYTKAAIDGVRAPTALTGPHWEFYGVLLGPDRVWWVIQDGKTGYILASQVSPVSEEPIREVIKEAWSSSSARPRCRSVCFSLIKPSRSHRRRTISEPFVLRCVGKGLPRATVVSSRDWTDSVSGISVNHKFPAALLTAGKRFNRVKNRRLLETYVKGWAISYNFLGGHGRGMTPPPGQLANVETHYRSWVDVVRKLGRLSPQHIDECRIASESRQ